MSAISQYLVHCIDQCKVMGSPAAWHTWAMTACPHETQLIDMQTRTARKLDVHSVPMRKM